MNGGSYDDAPNAAPLLSDEEWRRLRFERHRLGRGDFREDIGADAEQRVSVRDLITRRAVWDPAESGSA